MIAHRRRAATRRRETDRRLHVPEPRTTSWWEWRIFGPQIQMPVAPDLLTEPTEAPATETWLLSPCSSFSVRVCHGQVEIKRLERIDRRGLELWRVIHRYRFPLDAAAVATVSVDLGASVPDLEGSVDLERFLSVMHAAAPSVVVRSVRTQRSPFRLDGCRGEHVKLTVGSGQWETVALVGQDPGPVHAALQRLGFSRFANMNYPRALKLMLGVADRAAAL